MESAVVCIDYRKVLDFIQSNTNMVESDEPFYRLLALAVDKVWESSLNGCESTLNVVRMFCHLLEVHGAKAGERYDDLVRRMRMSDNRRKLTLDGLLKLYAATNAASEDETRFSPDVVRLVKKFCDLRSVFDRVDAGRFVSVAGKRTTTDRASGERIVGLTFRKPALVPISSWKRKKDGLEYLTADDYKFVDRINELIKLELGSDFEPIDRIAVCNYKDAKCFSLDTFDAEDSADLYYVAASSVKLYIGCDTSSKLTIRAKIFPDRIVDDLSYIGLGK